LIQHPDYDPAVVDAALDNGEPPPVVTEPRATGRPSKLSPEVQKIIVTAVSRGMYYEAAASLAGVTYATLRNWYNRGEVEAERRSSPRVKSGTRKWEREQPYFEFFDALKKAQATAQYNALRTIDTASNSGTWQAAAWLLERRHPDQFGRRDRIDANVAQTDDGMTVEEWREQARKRLDDVTKTMQLFDAD
jgi:DNA-binding transcriptional MerR regulator